MAGAYRSEQGPLLLKEGDNYTLHIFMTKTAETPTFVGNIREYPRLKGTLP